jgi:hypothetical protein
VLEQALGVLGALVILGAYAGLQWGRLDRLGVAFNALNFAGAAVLTVIAVRSGQWGFVLLEGVWALLSLPPLLRGVRR